MPGSELENLTRTILTLTRDWTHFPQLTLLTIATLVQMFKPNLFAHQCRYKGNLQVPKYLSTSKSEQAPIRMWVGTWDARYPEGNFRFCPVQLAVIADTRRLLLTAA